MGTLFLTSQLEILTARIDWRFRAKTLKAQLASSWPLLG